jgi:hypothetical protein
MEQRGTLVLQKTAVEVVVDIVVTAKYLTIMLAAMAVVDLRIASAAYRWCMLAVVVVAGTAALLLERAGQA